MTTTTRSDGATASARRDGSAVTFARVVRSEAVKLRTLPSTYILLAGSIAAMVAVGALAAGGLVLASRDGHPAADAAIRAVPTAGLSFGQLLLGALAVLLISSEFGTGSIRPTLTAAPRRLGVLAAKALVAALLGAVTGAAAALATHLLVQPILAEENLDYRLDGQADWWALLATGLYLALVAVLAVALGTLLRNSAGAIVAVIGLLFVLPTALSMIPGETAADILRYLPSEAGNQLMATEIGDGELRPWEGGLVMAGWTLTALVAAAVGFRRRDV
ncbi:ABC transporter permease subunit [Naasia sp. SYSU D00948]|uniref:ABC transporter permease subunit n=1 Tax=Naasia sp. SYSU D00948 TaxID=2817379 RepID=UPI001B306AE2|nr:ABC transporter permease subunit [Naasia sp. SYSU D00948]